MNDKRCFGQFGFMGLYCDLACNDKHECIKIKNTMETKELKIEIPEGYEIDESRSSFEKIVFKKKEKKLPKSWEEFQTSERRKELTYVATSKWSGGVSKEYFDKLIVLSKLLELRDVYNDGWKPNWNDDCWKPCISCCKGEVERNSRCSYHCILAFKSEKLRDEFYNNFKDLIEQAKELL